MGFVGDSRGELGAAVIGQASGPLVIVAVPGVATINSAAAPAG